MDKKHENRLESAKDNQGDDSAKPKKAKKNKFRWKGERAITLPHVGRVAPEGVFTVNPEWEKANRILAFVENNENFEEVK